MAYTSNYTRVNWQNDPSHSTPLGQTLLNRMDTKIYELDTAMGNIDADYLVSLKNGDAFVGFNVDETTGKITMTRLSGAKVEFDTDLEKVPLQYEVDKVNEKLILTQSDGTKVELDLSDFISVFEFTDTAEIIWDTSEDNKVKANLATNYLSDVQTAKTEAVNASKEAKSYAVGGTNTRTGEDTDNAKYYKEQAKAIVGFDGSAKTIPFDNSTNGFTAGNVQDAIEEASTKGGGGASSADKVTFSDTKSSLGATNVQDAIDKVVEKKLDKPTTAGTKGQILTVGDNNTVVWEDNEGQGALTYTKAEWNALATKPKDGTHVVITDDGIGVGGSGSGTTVVANPTDTATEALSKLKVGTTTYSVGGGSTITVDSALSDTSTNPVQNKVIKSAIDAKQDALTIDTALSTTSTNTVQNKVVAEAINNKIGLKRVWVGATKTQPEAINLIDIFKKTKYYLTIPNDSNGIILNMEYKTDEDENIDMPIGTVFFPKRRFDFGVCLIYVDKTGNQFGFLKLTYDTQEDDGKGNKIYTYSVGGMNVGTDIKMLDAYSV